MIEKMLRLMVAVRSSDRQKLLDVLGEAGVMHLTPVDSSLAVPDEKVIQEIERCSRAMQILDRIDGVELEEIPEVDDVVKEVLAVDQSLKDARERILAIQRQLLQQEIWGDTRTAQIDELRKAGFRIRFFTIPEEEVELVKADLVDSCGEAGGRVLIATVMRDGFAEVPPSAEQIRFPIPDNPTLRKELKEYESRVAEQQEKLAALVNLRSKIEERERKLQVEAEYMTAERGGYAGEEIFALQGWVPEIQSREVEAALERAGVDGGLKLFEPELEDLPPTLIRYPGWAKPIQGLFDILGTFPGYFELDLSGFFMLALPLFAGILIGDAGYGLVFMLPGIIYYKKLVSIAGKAKTQLLMIIGAATLVYGILTGNYFGITPDSLSGKEGVFWMSLESFMRGAALLWDPDPNVAREIIIKLSFSIGCVHLMMAHLKLLIGYAPNLKALAELGWCSFLLGMFGLVWGLFFPEQGAPIPMSFIIHSLIWGAVLIVLFGTPHPNPLKRVGVGIASSILPWLGTFSDLMSYIRLMAVGLASYYIATATNQLACDAAVVGTWFVGTIILVFGHALNIALGVIAIFAHGVRLNMLEFSNNAGVQWGGYSYFPFAGSRIEEN